MVCSVETDRFNSVEKTKQWLSGTVFFVLMLAAIYIITQKQLLPESKPNFPTSLSNLPYYAFYSFTRMFFAYLFAIIFSLIYGLTAALKKGADKVMLPILDVLQSVPVLGFFPAAVFFFIGLFPGRLGVEMASIFLIFTSQAWNMTFGVYEAVKGIPKDLKESSLIYGVKGYQALKKLYLPASANRLVYNSVLSWAGGWYFLVATEIIASGSTNYRLPGLGSFLVITSARGRIGLTLIGLAVLVAIIVTMDILLWRPLIVWSEKFRYEFTVDAAETHHSLLLGLFNRFRSTPLLKLLTKTIKKTVALPINAIGAPANLWLFYYRRHRRARLYFRLIGKALNRLILAGIIYMFYLSAVALIQIAKAPIPSEARLIPLATLASMGRLAVAYLISLIWTIPIAVKIAGSRRAARFLTPFFEISASIPATALFPLMIVFIIRYTGSVNLAAILLVLTGMQWYLLFNLISGATSIPGDLREVAEMMGLKGWLYWRKVILPAIFPSLITGSITAWGGGWNALIVAEYFKFGTKTFSAFGIGSLLDQATYVRTADSSQMILLSLVFMIVVIMVLNRFFWRPLYNFAIKRFRLEY